MTRLIVPNYHVILIHVPLALLGIGLLIEIFSFCWRRTSFHIGGRWMILIGALAMTPAATSGIFALQDVLSRGGGVADSWTQLQQQSGLSTMEWELVRDHVMLGGVAAGAALIGVVLWLASCDPFRDRMGIAVLLTFIISMSLAAVGAWHGGEMVFREGFGVDGLKSVLMGAPATNTTHQRLDVLLQPLQIHVIIAGAVFAMAAAALGLSLRQCSVLYRVEAVDDQPVQNAATYLAMPTPSISDDPREPMVTHRVVSGSGLYATPSGRFWVLAALLTLLAVASGLYVVGFFSPPISEQWNNVKDNIRAVMTKDQRRVGLHIIFGASILVLTLILAILGRFSPRNFAFCSILSLLLILVMAAQVWVGILMLYDNDDGPITHFKREPAASVTPKGTTLPSTMPTTVPSTQP